jgi:hypothetical protein
MYLKKKKYAFEESQSLSFKKKQIQFTIIFILVDLIMYF